MSLKSVIVVVTVGIVLAACGGEGVEQEGGQPEAMSSSEKAPVPLASRLILSASPENSVAVKEMKDGVTDGGEVVVYGRLREFVSGFAAFTLVDQTIKHCAERECDTCETPWDYCCEEASAVAIHSVTVEVHENGKIMRADLSKFDGMERLAKVVVRGQATKSPDGNVIVVADGIFVSK